MFMLGGLPKELSDALVNTLNGHIKIGRWWTPTEEHIETHKRMRSTIEEYLKFAEKWTAFAVALSCFGL